MQNESEEAYVARIFELTPEELEALDGHISVAAAAARELVPMVERTPREGELDANVYRRWLIEAKIRLAGQTYTPLAAVTHPLLGQELLEDLREARGVRQAIRGRRGDAQTAVDAGVAALPGSGKRRST